MKPTFARSVALAFLVAVTACGGQHQRTSQPPAGASDGVSQNGTAVTRIAPGMSLDKVLDHIVAHAPANMYWVTDSGIGSDLPQVVTARLQCDRPEKRSCSPLEGTTLIGRSRSDSRGRLTITWARLIANNGCSIDLLQRATKLWKSAGAPRGCSQLLGMLSTNIDPVSHVTEIAGR